MSNNPLDAMISTETMTEIIETFDFQQLLIAYLRIDGLNNIEIAKVLGVSHQAVHYHMKKARRDLLATYPYLIPVLEGRNRQHVHRLSIIPPQTP